MQYGKKTVTESFFDGKTMKKEMAYSIPVKICDQAQALTEFLKVLDLVKSKQSDEIVIRIKAPNFKLQLMTKEYTTREEL